MVYNILIAGVGGQGSILAAKILGQVFKNEGYDVKVSEIHGMSQRGGSVVTYVRYGDKVYSPLIEKGEADIILAFEQLEGYRYVSYLKKEGEMILSTQTIEPMPVISGADVYPENIHLELIDMGVNIRSVNAIDIAQAIGNVKTVNIILLGCMAKTLNISKIKWENAIKNHVPPKLIDINIKAFETGYKLLNEGNKNEKINANL